MMISFAYVYLLVALLAFLQQDEPFDRVGSLKPSIRIARLSIRSFAARTVHSEYDLVAEGAASARTVHIRLERISPGNPNSALTNLELSQYWEASHLRRTALRDRLPEYGLPDGFEENRAGIQAAAVYLYEQFKREDIPEIVRLQCVWAVFGFYSPQYFFSDSFLGETLELSNEQIEAIRQKCNRIAKELPNELKETEEVITNRIFQSLRPDQRKKMESVCSIKNWLQIACEAEWTRFDYNFVRDSLGGQYYDIPSTLFAKNIESSGELTQNDMVVLQDCRYRPASQLFDVVSKFGAPPLQAETRALLDIDRSKKSNQIRYQQVYSDFLDRSNDRSRRMMILAEFRMRGIRRFLEEAAVQQWLEIDADQLKKIRERSMELTDEYYQMRHQIINNRCDGLFDSLDAKQRKDFKSLFGLNITEFETVFQECENEELNGLFAKAKPKLLDKIAPNRSRMLGPPR